MPAYTRLIPASSAAWEKLVNERVTPGIASDVVVKAVWSPKNAARTVLAAPLKVLWPESYDGKLGVVRSGVQVGSAAVAGLPSVSAARMAVIGRQKLYVYFASQQAIPASARAMSRAANSRAFCSMEVCC